MSEDEIGARLREAVIFCAEKMREDNEIDGWQGNVNVNLSLDALLAYTSARAAVAALEGVKTYTIHTGVAGHEDSMRQYPDKHTRYAWFNDAIYSARADLDRIIREVSDDQQQ